nr:alpha/beta fold hydrolase [Rhodococcus marinonascens]
MSRARTELGIELPIRALFDTPTIAELSPLLHRDFTIESTNPLAPLLTISPSGSRPPLFCIHPGAGSAWSYLALAQHLPDQPIYGLQAHGLDGTAPLARSIPEMVNDYVDEVVALSPSGPIELLGLSFGGVVAHAMAVELDRRGRSVTQLVLMDSAPSIPANHEPTRQVMTDEAAIQKDFRAAAEVRYGDITNSPEFSALEDSLLEIFVNNARLRRDYQSPIYVGDLLIVRADTTHDGKPSEPLGPQWAEFVEGSITERTVAATHDTMDSPEIMKQVRNILEEFTEAKSSS